LLTTLLQMVKLTRAHIGIAVLPSFILGSLFAVLLGNEFNTLIFIWGFIIIFLMYSAASYINDYYDFEADKYNRQFGFSGGSGVLQQYPHLKNVTKNTALAFIFLSLILTVLLAWMSFLSYWIIGYIGIAAFFIWFYSAPPIRLSYRNMSEIPHFIAGIMNTCWGYILLTGRIDASIIIFAIPLSLHLLNVILIFEIPDREADIFGGKKNIIVNYGRQKSFLLISIIFWLSNLYFLLLAITGWYSHIINFWYITILSLIPSFLSTYTYVKKPLAQHNATRYAIKNAISIMFFSNILLIYFIYLLF
jgi:1,4-dihydroxy-2-naphthoate polyprenyltransferase